MSSMLQSLLYRLLEEISHCWSTVMLSFFQSQLVLTYQFQEHSNLIRPSVSPYFSFHHSSFLGESIVSCLFVDDKTIQFHLSNKYPTTYNSIKYLLMLMLSKNLSCFRQQLLILYKFSQMKVQCRSFNCSIYPLVGFKFSTLSSFASSNAFSFKIFPIQEYYWIEHF